MKILIGKKFTTPVDYSPYLTESSNIRIGQRRMITDFERSHNDVHLQFSNHSGVFTTLFKGAKHTDRYTIAITPDDSDRTTFSGELYMPSIDFSITGETVDLDAFSVNKTFWELAGKTKLTNPYGGPHYWTIEYTTVKDVLTMELNGTDIRNLYSELDIDPMFADRPIRGWQDAANMDDPSVGDNGRYKDLSPDTTIAELLEAFSYYYNAEFYIDDATLKFTMKQRGAVITDSQHDIDDKLKQDSSPSIYVAKDQAYDYVHTLLAVAKPTPPLITSVGPADAGRGFLGIKSWMVTFVFSVSGFELESIESQTSGAIYLQPQTVGGQPRGAKVGLTIPVGALGTLKRRLYRADWSNTRDGVTTVDWYQASKYYLVNEIADNSTTFVYDDTDIAADARTFFNEAAKRGSIWWGFNYDTGTWRAPIVDDGVTPTPSGKILEVTPKLRFVNPNNREEVLDFNILDMVAFFGGALDFDLERLVTQWQIVFTVSQGLIGEFRGTNYRIGDTVQTPKTFYGGELLGGKQLVVVAADNKLIEDASELEMMTV